MARREAAGGDAGDRREPRPRAPTGALVASVVPNGPAAEAGLKTGDLIVAIDGQTGRRSQRLRLPLRHQAARRHGAARRAARRQAGSSSTVALETAPDTGRDEIVSQRRARRSGREGRRPSSPALADELHLDADTEGVVVTDRRRRQSPAASVGFQKGDIILAVNNEKIEQDRATSSSRRRAASGIWRITLGARRPADQRQLGG